MEAIEVISRWDDQGQVTPLSFVWKGSSFPVETTGRRWQDGSGLHVLVMVLGGRACELIFQPQELKWYMGYRGEVPGVI